MTLYLSKRTLTLFSAGRFMAMLLILGVSKAQLSPNFYATTCPNLVAIVSARVRAVLERDPRMGASLLRLSFHDCFVQGCDASVLLDDTSGFTGEKSAFPNLSLRGFEVIDDIKTAVETACPNVVSCADILSLAARESVVALRGPTWTVGLGRRDSTTASLRNANSQLPAPFLDLGGLIASFESKGLTASQMVALSGSHTIGQARCGLYRSRIYNGTNINRAYAEKNQAHCPRTGGENNLSPLDEHSPNVFNNEFFRNLVQHRGLLHSDQQLFSNGSTDAQVLSYAGSGGMATFFRDFADAMVAMQNLTPLTGTNGQVRGNCRRTN